MQMFQPAGLLMCNYAASVSPQVIYKKFHISCPLQTVGNSSESQLLPDSCSGRLLTITQEVRRSRLIPWKSTCPPLTQDATLQTAYAIPILAFAFVCHPEVLPIYSELHK